MKTVLNVIYFQKLSKGRNAMNQQYEDSISKVTSCFRVVAWIKIVANNFISKLVNSSLFPSNAKGNKTHWNHIVLFTPRNLQTKRIMFKIFRKSRMKSYPSFLMILVLTFFLAAHECKVISRSDADESVHDKVIH